MKNEAAHFALTDIFGFHGSQIIGGFFLTQSPTPPSLPYRAICLLGELFWAERQYETENPLLQISVCFWAKAAKDLEWV